MPSADQDPVTRRVIHTTADFDYAETMTYSPDALETAYRVLRFGGDIVTDTNMTRSGINKKFLRTLGGEVHCFMAEPDVAAEAQGAGRDPGDSEHGAGLEADQAPDRSGGKCAHGAGVPV